MTRPDAMTSAYRTVNQIAAMVAYWDRDQRCVFANEAYREWFGRSPASMIGMTMHALLGPLYELNLPYIEGALAGRKQSFERIIVLPNGERRHTIATYAPDVVDGVVEGFSVHVADVTSLREREAALERAIAERDEALAEVRTLRGLLPICASCKQIRDEEGHWQALERYISERSEARFTHSICQDCAKKLYPELYGPK